MSTNNRRANLPRRAIRDGLDAARSIDPEIKIVILLPHNPEDQDQLVRVAARESGIRAGIHHYLVENGLFREEQLEIIRISKGRDALAILTDPLTDLSRTHLVLGARFGDMRAQEVLEHLQDVGCLPATRIICTMEYKLKGQDISFSLATRIREEDTGIIGSEIVKYVTGAIEAIRPGMRRWQSRPPKVDPSSLADISCSV